MDCVLHQVMSQPHYTKWNFDVLSVLVEGPLLNPKRLEEAMKGTRFGKRLMSFFWPRSRRFSNIDKTSVCNSRLHNIAPSF